MGSEASTVPYTGSYSPASTTRTAGLLVSFVTTVPKSSDVAKGKLGKDGMFWEIGVGMVERATADSGAVSSQLC